MRKNNVDRLNDELAIEAELVEEFQRLKAKLTDEADQYDYVDDMAADLVRLAAIQEDLRDRGYIAE